MLKGDHGTRVGRPAEEVRREMDTGPSPDHKAEKVAEICGVFLRHKQQLVLSEEGGEPKKTALVWMTGGGQCP